MPADVDNELAALKAQLGAGSAPAELTSGSPETAGSPETGGSPQATAEPGS